MKDLETEYRNRISLDTPDLWARIEAGIDKFEAEKREATKAADITDINDAKASAKKKDHKQLIFALKRISAAAAGLLVITVAIGVINSNKSSMSSAMSESAQAPQPAAEAAYDAAEVASETTDAAETDIMDAAAADTESEEADVRADAATDDEAKDIADMAVTEAANAYEAADVDSMADTEPTAGSNASSKSAWQTAGNSADTQSKGAASGTSTDKADTANASETMQAYNSAESAESADDAAETEGLSDALGLVGFKKVSDMHYEAEMTENRLYLFGKDHIADDSKVASFMDNEAKERCLVSYRMTDEGTPEILAVMKADGTDTLIYKKNK